MSAEPAVSPTADILAFPAPDPMVRLQMAMRSLVAALEEQREAVMAFRDSMVALRDATTDLGSSVATFQAQMTTLDGQVRHLGEVAKAGASPLEPLLPN
jgi:phage-related tail protein